MSIALLAQAQSELRRLSVAGSRFAKDDFRLKRLIEPLQTAGTKIAVFKAIAQALEKLVEASKQESAAALIRASGMVSAVLATQGRHTVDGELSVVEGEELAVVPETNGSARRLRPVLEALSTTGSGRLECIKEAFKDGLFADFRLMRLAIDHLEDPYPPVADFIAEKVLPSYGPLVLPKLKEQLDLKKGARHARIIRTIFAIEGEVCFDFLAQALDEGSAEVRVAAVEGLKHIEAAHALLLAHAKDKHQDVRRAVVDALGNRAGEDVIKVLIETFNGKEYYNAYQAIRSNDNEALTKTLIDLLPECLEQAIAADAAKQQSQASQNQAQNKQKKQRTQIRRADHYNRLCRLIELLGYRQHVGIIDALRQVFDRWKQLSEGVQLDLLQAIVAQGDSPLRDEIVAGAETFTGSCREFGIRVLFDAVNPDEAFDRISPLCVKGKRGREAMIRALPNHADWDERWLDFGIEHEIEPIILRTARKGHEACLQWLDTKHRASKVNEVTYLEKLIRLEAPQAADLFTYRVKSKKVHGNWYRYRTFHLAQYFSVDHLERFEQLATELPDSEALAFIEAIEPLRKKSSSSSK